MAAPGSKGGRKERHQMGLKVELKAGERFILGECLVTNGSQRTRLLIEVEAPSLREKDIMTTRQADTPAKRIYLSVQLMYTSRDPRASHETYFALVADLIRAAPSAWPYIEAINNHILAGEMYKALKATGKLIAYEKELIDHATSLQNLPQGREAKWKSA